jgi:ABC-type antimicrobial peptide transport system permease subunit
MGLLARGSLLPTTPGLVAGVLLSLGASQLLSKANESFPVLSISDLARTGIFLVLASILACLFPALRAARLSPARALKEE